MTSGGKFFEAFKSIMDELNENVNNDENVEAIEAENEQLRKKKMELMVNLNCRPSTSDSSIVLVKDILLRQKNLNQFRMQSKDNSLLRFKNRSAETDLQTSTWKQKLQDVDDLITLPYHDVVHKIEEMEDKIAEIRSIIEELKKQHSSLIQNEQAEANATEDISFIETLRCAAVEQSKLIESLKKVKPNK